MPNRMYEKGTRFESKVRDDLDSLGYLVMRAAGSKGHTKIDLVAFHPEAPLMLIQCKNGAQITKEEWDQVFRVARWYKGTAVPIVAENGPNGHGVTYTMITGERIRYGRTQPAVGYDPDPSHF